MEADNVHLDKNSSRRPNEPSNGILSDKARRGGSSGRGARGGKRGGGGGGEGRSRRGRGRRGGGPGKPNESSRGIISNPLNITNVSKPVLKTKNEPRDPPLLEVGHKVVVRHLPPTLPKEVLLESAGVFVPVDKIEWSSFIPGKVSDNPSKPRVFSRAYFRFTDSAHALKFIECFNGHIFVDSKGIQDKAVVEYAPYRKTPKQARADPKQNTIEEDVDYQEFLASLNPENPPETSKPVSHSTTQSSDNQKITPLIEFLRAKKAAQVESRSFRPTKSSVTVLSRNDKNKNSETSEKNPSNSNEGTSKKEDKRSKKAKSSKGQSKEPNEPKETKQVDFKPNSEESANRRSRRRVRKKGPLKEETNAPSGPIQILKPPPKNKEVEADWPQPGSSSNTGKQVKEPNGKLNEKPTFTLATPEAKPNSTPVRHVFTLTNGCLTQSTKGSPESLDTVNSKGSRNNRRRRPPPSKPQAAS